MSSDILGELLANLSSNDDMIRESAVRDAAGLPSRAKLTLFRMAAHRYRRQLRRYRLRDITYFLLVALWLISLQITPEPWHGGLLAAMIAGFVWNGASNGSPERARRQLVLLGQNIEDVRFVMPLLHLLYGPETQSPDPVLAEVLKRLLPKLQHSDTKRWSSEDRRLLLLPLEDRSDPNLTLCMLKALEQVGDEIAVPTVEQLARMRLYDPRISQAARECLPYLYEHVQQLRQAQTLLRAADESAAAPDNLLRPARGDTDNEAYEELLRPDSPQPPAMDSDRSAVIRIDPS